jgi:hypothetical protein
MMVDVGGEKGVIEDTQKEMIDNIPLDTCILELASYPGGFDDMFRVTSASGLPGKIFPVSSAQIIFEAIRDLFPR